MKLTLEMCEHLFKVRERGRVMLFRVEPHDRPVGEALARLQPYKAHE